MISSEISIVAVETTLLPGDVIQTNLVPSSRIVTTLATVGPQGPKGEPGTSTQTHEAGTNLSGHRAIRVASGLAYVCDGSNAAHAGRCIGISTGAAAAGDDLNIQTAGLLTELSWTFSEGPVYVGADGQLAQTVTGLAFVQQIGMAVSATQIDINPQLAILH